MIPWPAETSLNYLFEVGWFLFGFGLCERQIANSTVHWIRPGQLSQHRRLRPTSMHFALRTAWWFVVCFSPFRTPLGCCPSVWPCRRWYRLLNCHRPVLGCLQSAGCCHQWRLLGDPGLRGDDPSWVAEMDLSQSYGGPCDHSQPCHYLW